MCRSIILLLKFMTVRNNFRFGGPNSRLGARKFPIGPPREFTDNSLIWLMIFGTKPVLPAAKSKNSRFNGKALSLCVR